MYINDCDSKHKIFSAPLKVNIIHFNNLLVYYNIDSFIRDRGTRNWLSRPNTYNTDIVNGIIIYIYV